jgi:hypothetical protein
MIRLAVHCRLCLSRLLRVRRVSVFVYAADDWQVSELTIPSS